jgi:hypothetical protein
MKSKKFFHQANQSSDKKTLALARVFVDRRRGEQQIKHHILRSIRLFRLSFYEGLSKKE